MTWLLLTLHECDGWVGLLAGPRLADTVDCLHHEGVDSVGLESINGDPGEGAVGVEGPHWGHPELGRVLLVDALGADGDDVVRDGARRVLAGPGTAPSEADTAAGEPRNERPGGRGGRGWNY